MQPLLKALIFFKCCSCYLKSIIRLMINVFYLYALIKSQLGKNIRLLI